MNIKFILNLSAYIIFFGIYYIFLSTWIDRITGYEISVGLLLIITGIWGIFSKQYLLKIFFFENHKNIVNGIIALIGVFLILYTILWC